MGNHSVSKKVAGVFVLTLLLVGGLALGVLGNAQEARRPGADGLAKPSDDGAAVLFSSTNLTYHVCLPLVLRNYEDGPRSFRVGYCSTGEDIKRYPDIRELAAGWYVNFEVDPDPSRPLGMEHVQTVRLHQVTDCWPNKVRDRDACPYVEPYTYTLTSPTTTVALRTSVEANPGALWLIGNEMDRHDWGGKNPWNSDIVNPVNPYQGQDEMMPELYARAYHELYHLIKEADPRALVAIGGIIQATPARLAYLSTVWETYRDRYGQDMPVDVWNVHNFILKERCNDWGADVPPGYDGCQGTVYDDSDHNSMKIFKEQIRAFREWMKARGQQNKPLIVSEYGILYFHAGMEDPDLVREFMEKTFEFFMTEKDCDLGYPADECRLVQRWAWYSLDDMNPDFNMYQRLFDKYTREMTGVGQSFAAYTEQHLDIEGGDVPGYWPTGP